jgi:hypothetical protein
VLLVNKFINSSDYKKSIDQEEAMPSVQHGSTCGVRLHFPYRFQVIVWNQLLNMCCILICLTNPETGRLSNGKCDKCLRIVRVTSSDDIDEK